MTPLVTVTIPCYQAADTLPVALASLVAQTVEDFECVIVDDGSPTPVRRIIDQFDDDRFRLFEFDDNRGRPVARQKALDEARGEFVCMLDADDWYFADKLEHQLRILEDRPDLAAVSTSVAVIDDAGELTGVRAYESTGLEIRTADANRPPQLSFPATMLRAEVAASAHFDPRLRRAEDPDYLMEALGGRRYGLTDRICYAYREQFSPRAIREALLAYRCQRITFRDQMQRAPVAGGLQYLGSLVKTGVYRMAAATGRGRWLFERRNRAARAAECGRFDRHRSIVEDLLSEVGTP